MKQIYKNLYYNREEGKYEFVDETNRQDVKSQESYLLVYLIEILLKQKEAKNEKT